MKEHPSPPPGALLTYWGRLDGGTGSSCSWDDRARHAGLPAASNRAACQGQRSTGSTREPIRQEEGTTAHGSAHVVDLFQEY